MKKTIINLILLGLFLSLCAQAETDVLFKQMEEKGVFKKVRANFIGSCYSKKPATAPTKDIDLGQLKAQYPERSKVCGCFQDELSKVSNRTIFDESRSAYKLFKETVKARQKNDTEKLKALTEKAKDTKTSMAIIAKKCNIR